MEIAEVKRKRRWLTIGLALTGFVFAAVIWAYLELRDFSPAKPLDASAWMMFIVMCPPSLLSIPLIDVEPGSVDFASMWLVIGLVNSFLYGTFGLILGRVCWKSRTAEG